MTTPKINCSFIRKNGKQCTLKPDSDLLSQGYCFRHRITEKEKEPPAVEINKAFCSFICSNGKQCNLKPDTDLLAQGCCFRHRITKQEQEHVHVDINKDFCSFILKNGKQCKLRPNTLGRCYLHKIKKQAFDLFRDFETIFNIRQEQPRQEQPRQEQLRQKQKQTTATRILKDREITTKEEWKGWIRKNHPDKGGDTHLFIDILKAGRIVFV